MCLKSLRFFFPIFLPEGKTGLEPPIGKNAKLYLSQWNLVTQRIVKAGKTIQPSTLRLGCWVTASCCFSLCLKHWREGENRHFPRQKDKSNQCGEECGANVSISASGKTEGLLGPGSDIIITTLDNREICYIQVTRNEVFGCFIPRRMHSMFYITLRPAWLHHVLRAEASCKPTLACLCRWGSYYRRPCKYGLLKGFY